MVQEYPECFVGLRNKSKILEMVGLENKIGVNPDSQINIWFISIDNCIYILFPTPHSLWLVLSDRSVYKIVIIMLKLNRSLSTSKSTTKINTIET